MDKDEFTKKLAKLGDVADNAGYDFIGAFGNKDENGIHVVTRCSDVGCMSLIFCILHAEYDGDTTEILKALNTIQSAFLRVSGGEDFIHEV